MENKPKILLITDGIYCNSGVGNMAKEIVYNSIDEFDYLIVGAFAQTQYHGQVFDYSEQISKETGVSDVFVREIQFNGYGTVDLFTQIFQRENIDAVLLMSDPRHHLEFFSYNYQIRQICPIIWYNVWDATPTPDFNLPYYDSCDGILNISKLTHDSVIDVLKDKAKNKVVKFVPHGVDLQKFYPIDEKHPEYNNLINFKKGILGDSTGVVYLFNSVNSRRKNIGSLIEGFVKNMANGDGSSKLVLHTQANGDYQIPKIIDKLCKDYGVNFKGRIILTNTRLDDKQMLYLYNSCDYVVNFSYNEGWGLSLTEGMACGKPFIAPYHGGMKTQYDIVMDFNDKEIRKFKEYVINPYVIESVTLLDSSPVVPYIHNYIASTADLMECFGYARCDVNLEDLNIETTRNFYRKVAETEFDSKRMVSDIIDGIFDTINNFEPQPKYQIINA